MYIRWGSNVKVLFVLIHFKVHFLKLSVVMDFNLDFS